MPIVSVGVTATRLIYGHAGRKTLVLTNEGSADEIVRIYHNRTEVPTSAVILYNRETYRITGAYAKMEWWAISDTATTDVSVTELRT